MILQIKYLQKQWSILKMLLNTTSYKDWDLALGGLVMQSNIKGGKFLVTGCAGFIGSFVTEAFLAKGAYVYGIDNLNTGSLNNIEHLLKDKNFHFIKGDICDTKITEKLVKKADYIYHAAVRGI